MFAIAGVISIIFTSTIALRMIFIYPLLPFSFVVCLFADLLIGILPLVLALVILFVIVLRDKAIQKRAQQRQSIGIKGLEPQHCQTYNAYLSDNYPQIVDVLKRRNIIFRWDFKIVFQPEVPIIKFVNGRNVVNYDLSWTVGEIEFLENPTEQERTIMAEKLQQCQREAEERLSDKNKLFGIRIANNDPQQLPAARIEQQAMDYVFQPPNNMGLPNVQMGVSLDRAPLPLIVPLKGSNRHEGNDDVFGPRWPQFSMGTNYPQL